MFKEDELIDLESLVEYGVGLGIFNNLDSIQDARHRVQIAVDTLKSSFLLLSMDDEVFMHEVVRDVALLITSKGKEKFLVMAGKELMEWKPRNNTSESYTKISLMHNKIRELPDNELYFPLLDTFLIQYNQVEIVPNEFFLAMKEVKVLDMSGNNISSLPQSLKLLTKLCSLNLSFNRSLHEISILGDLKDLEILKLRGTGIRHIPKEIGQLTNLRLLDVDICKSLSYVTPGVISKLKFLETLHIGFFLEQDGKCWPFSH
ncbi:disease resistance protein-like protein [Tanacetum coccineum]